MEHATKPAIPAVKPDAFFAMDRIPVRLTYGFTDPPTVITFFCKLALTSEDEQARQAFYAQPEGDRVAGQHAYYVDLLCRVTTKRPDGLPGFEEFYQSREGLTLEVLRGALREYLSEPSEMKVKVVADAIEQYNRLSQPAEFFR